MDRKSDPSYVAWKLTSACPKNTPEDHGYRWYRIELPHKALQRILTLCLDDPYAAEKLGDPRMAISIVQPLVDILYDAHDISIGNCVLLI